MKNRMNSYRGKSFALPALLLGSVLLLLTACATTSTTSTAAASGSEKPELMFVQVAENLKVDTAAQTFRLVRVSPQTLYFSDRPVRVAGHIKMDKYLEEWTAKAGKDNFAQDPPNATLSVFEPGQVDNTLVVVEITNPKIEGADLIYSYKLIDGKLPSGGEAASLFIDWIGVGGGVGVGFHGVGVGRRGPGIR